METLTREGHLPPGPPPGLRRRLHRRSMCALSSAVRDNQPARSLAAITPQQVIGLDIEPHPAGRLASRPRSIIMSTSSSFPASVAGCGRPWRLRASRAGSVTYAASPAADSTARASSTGSGWPSNGSWLAARTKRYARNCGSGSSIKSAGRLMTWCSL